jgi:hypothetical protein
MRIALFFWTKQVPRQTSRVPMDERHEASVWWKRFRMVIGSVRRSSLAFD